MPYTFNASFHINVQDIKIVNLLIAHKSPKSILDSHEVEVIYGYVKPNAIKALHKVSVLVFINTRCCRLAPAALAPAAPTPAAAAPFRKQVL